ncbi:MAG: hypothetical protein KTR18_10335 [Acidiferrobacterales bacterium]|nr:hypothetical protein [Acidiferrobacterales bacterium]
MTNFVTTLIPAIWHKVRNTYRRDSCHWNETEPVSEPISYINTSMAIRPDILGHSLPLGYRLSCLYFGSPLLDRTSTLGHGYPQYMLDPLSDLTLTSVSFSNKDNATTVLSNLCLQRARDILQRAREEQREIRILWSGGIDSTAVACALLRESDPALDQLNFYFSYESVWEYRKFYKNILKGNQTCTRFSTIEELLGSPALIVTGEHGDQLFGSMKALAISWRELNQSWQAAFPEHLTTLMGSSYRAETVLDYLSPQISQSPAPLYTLFDLLWWINFSMKWQNVAMRIPAQIDGSYRIVSEAEKSPDNPCSQFSLTEHFFRTEEFQRWALTFRESAIEPGNWRSYKLPLKQFIFEFTEDRRYLKKKQKVPSLNRVLNHNGSSDAIAIVKSGAIFRQARDTTLKTAIPGHESDESSSGDERGVTFSYSREKPLWDDIDSGGE